MPSQAPWFRRPRRALVLALALALAGPLLLAFALWAFPEHSTRLALRSLRRTAGLATHDITLAEPTETGTHYRFRYLDGGRGEPLLLLHGFGGDKDNFVPVASFLTAHFRVIIPDQLGFGESDKPPGADYSPSAQADRLHRLASALNLRRLHLAGNSMGGQIALAYAARHTHEVASLWLLAPAGLWSATRSAVVQDIANGKPNPLFIRDPQDFARLLRLILESPPPVPPPVMRSLAQTRLRNQVLEQRIFPQVLGESLEDRVRDLPIPTLIVWGDRDQVLHPDAGSLLRNLLPRSELVLMPHIGHVPMLEAPRRTATDYLQFHQRLATPTP